jgi:hypothetical protein
MIITSEVHIYFAYVSLSAIGTDAALILAGTTAGGDE